MYIHLATGFPRWARDFTKLFGPVAFGLQLFRRCLTWGAVFELSIAEEYCFHLLLERGRVLTRTARVPVQG